MLHGEVSAYNGLQFTGHDIPAYVRRMSETGISVEVVRAPQFPMRTIPWLCVPSEGRKGSGGALQ